MFEQYSASLWAVLLIVFTVLCQSLIATGAHRRQKKYVPGVVDENLGHASFVFRSHRTFQNSLENAPLMLFTGLIGILSGLSPTGLAVVLWIFAAARIAHMLLYYKIATERNPSPRSYFYAIALLSNLVLVGMIALHMLC
jgi:uncharacterized MAPEG superfamily protein